LKPTIEKESIHQDRNNNGVIIVNFVTSENLVFNSMIFAHKKFKNTPGPLLMGRLTTELITY